MRQGGVDADLHASRWTLAPGASTSRSSRTGDQVGASGAGLLAAILFEPVAAGHRHASTHRAASAHAVAGGERGRDAAVRARREWWCGEHAARWRRGRDGYTFVELLVVTTIVLILASAVLPLARVTIQRQREVELRRALREMRDAIDKFKDAVDSGQIAATELKAGSEGYPPTSRRSSRACRSPTTRRAAS